MQRGVGSEIFKFDPVHSQPSGTYSQDLPAMPSNLNVFGSTLTVKDSYRPGLSKRALQLPEVCCDLSVRICQGVADDMLCINFQWNLLARSCKGHQFCYQALQPKMLCSEVVRPFVGMSRRATEAAAESRRGSARSTSILNTNSRVSCSMLSCRVVLPIEDQNEVISFGMH